MGAALKCLCYTTTGCGELLGRVLCEFRCTFCLYDGLDEEGTYSATWERLMFDCS